MAMYPSCCYITRAAQRLHANYSGDEGEGADRERGRSVYGWQKQVRRLSDALADHQQDGEIWVYICEDRMGDWNLPAVC